MSDEIEVQLPVKDIQRIVKDAKVREIVAKCEQTEPGRIGECVEGELLDRLVQMFSEDATPVSMERWVAEDPDPARADCRPCALPVTIQWYSGELKARGLETLAKKLEETALTTDPLTSAKELDNIKAVVDGDTRKRLLDFDAATQANSIEEV